MHGLGDRKLLGDFNWWSLLNPLNVVRLWRDIKAGGARLKDKGIEMNMVGEGLIQGGIIVVGPGDQGVLYRYLEETGSEIPVEDIKAALAPLTARQPVA